MTLSAILKELAHAGLITSLVFVMMALVELLTVSSKGRLTGLLGAAGWRQYAVAALLGVIPGCAGSYLAVSMYSHGVFSLGALLANLIATAGDESFVMLAMFPRQAVVLFASLLVFGAAAGWLADRVFPLFGVTRSGPCALVEVHAEDIHPHDHAESWFPLRPRWRPAGPRLVLIAVLLLLAGGLAAGFFQHTDGVSHGGHALDLHNEHHDLESWIFLVVSLAGAALVLVSPAHTLADHLWRHLALHHAPRIFAWTAGTLIGVQVLNATVDLEALVAGRGLWLIVGAAALGLIPQSGPHLVVVTLFAAGQLPASALLANTIVQDGHALLPLLGIAPRDAVMLKAVKLVLGLAVGAAVLAAGM